MKRPLNSKVPYVSTASVAEALGVSTTTVKRWVDHNILSAHRTAGGHRKVLLDDVLRLARGGEFPQADLSRLESRNAADNCDQPRRLVKRLVDSLHSGDGNAVRGVLRGAYESGLSIEELADQIISPAMAQIGHEWATGTIDVFHEHRASQLLATALYSIADSQHCRPRLTRQVAIGGAIEFDHYVLPSLLAQLALSDSGWHAINLGPNTPFSSFHKAIGEFRPKLVWISISYLHDATIFAQEYTEFFHAAEASGAAIAIGGAALPNELRSQIPYSAYGDKMAHLVAFANSLSPQPRRPRRGRPLVR